MENKIGLFRNEVFGNVRAVMFKSDVWFVGKDVVECLGYLKHHSTIINSHCDKEDYVKMSFSELGNLGLDLGRQGGLLVNQYAILSLVMKSDLSQAKQFQRWVIKDIIPSVLKTGSYSVDEQAQPPSISQEQVLVLNIYDKRNNPAEFAVAVGQFGDYMYASGGKDVCDNKAITVKQIAQFIMQSMYDLFVEVGYFPNDNQLGTEFNRFLASKEYYELIRFKSKDGKTMERMKHYQPTPLFSDMFVDQSMAITKELSDGRGKITVTFTSNVFKYIVSDSFKSEFSSYIRGLYNNRLKVIGYSV